MMEITKKTPNEIRKEVKEGKYLLEQDIPQGKAYIFGIGEDSYAVIGNWVFEIRGGWFFIDHILLNNGETIKVGS